MKTTFLREVTLYRYRYIVGYVAFGCLLFALLLFAIDQAPRGLSQSELASAVASVNVNILKPTTTNIVDAPYHLLQKLSIQFFGLTPVAIKLPSILIGALTGIGIVFMLRKWFRKNVALVTAIMTVTSVGFLTLARTGTPMIMTALWTVMLLFGATQVLYAKKHQFLWKLFCMISIALLAYSPFGIYPLIAMVVAGIFHPHVRHQLKRGKRWQHAIAILAVSIILAPLIIAAIVTPTVGLQLIGIDGSTNFGPGHIVSNIAVIFNTLFNFAQNQVGVIVTPLFGLATSALIVLGVLKLFTATYSARSYMIFVWIGLLIPVLLLRPDMILLVVVPMTLVLAIGMDTLIRQWYDLFPRNPYARIAALIPLSVLLVSIVGIDMERYFYGYHYSPMASSFHAELPAIRSSLESYKLGTAGPVVLVVPENQVGFYDILRREFPQVSVRTGALGAKPPVIVLDQTESQLVGMPPTRIVTGDLSSAEQAVLLRVYMP